MSYNVPNFTRIRIHESNFCQVCKKTKKNFRSLLMCISGMAIIAQFFSNLVYSLRLEGKHLHNKFSIIGINNHRATNASKTHIHFFLLIH